MRWLPFLLLLSLPAAWAETEDPLVSLFHFQMRMAEGGNVRAMMKVGEMYENGEGTPRDYRRALEMYRKARTAGAAEAEAAIRRVRERMRAGTRQTSGKKTAPPGNPVPPAASARKAAKEKARREAAARRAEQEKAQREAATRKNATAPASSPMEDSPNNPAEENPPRARQFSSDPCKTRAARFLESCRKKRRNAP